MTLLTPLNLLLLMVVVLFLIGLATFITGVVLLALRTNSQDVKILANQTTQLAQKGLAEEVAGLVGNASTLLDNLNQMTRTAAGIGIFLTFLGMIMMGGACLLAIQIYRMLP